jgi:hypothetical protein
VQFGKLTQLDEFQHLFIGVVVFQQDLAVVRRIAVPMGVDAGELRENCAR